MMLRFLFLVALTVLLPVRASDKIDAPADGASVSVKQPHVVAELIPESSAVQAGKPFDVALHLHMDPDWHTYWLNPGDAGIPTTIKWTLPPGFTAGPIQWPTPEKHDMGGLMTYGYGGDVYLLTTLTPPKGDLPQHFDVKAKAEWLVCKEECIPGKAELSLSLDSGFMNLRLPKENTELFAQARARLPALSFMAVNAAYATSPAFPGKAGQEGILINLKSATVPSNPRFFPDAGNVLSNQDSDNLAPLKYGDSFTLPIVLQQNGERPDHLSGILVSSENFARQFERHGGSSDLGAPTNAVRLEDFPIMPGAGSASGGTKSTDPAPAEPAAATPSISPATLGDGPSPPIQLQGNTEAEPLLIGVLGAAFVGGLILNLMPCVLPVLSLKVFSLIKHAGAQSGKTWIQGVAFAAGVVLSFWALAGLLLALQAAGKHLGWGFQMQSPGFVAALIVLFFLIALNLFGVFEIGSSLVGVDSKASSRVGGSASSFLNGALATLAATPCTAPFMGGALGFAATQAWYVALLVFTFLAFGMATPYLLLTIFPQALRLVPKPGAWMEALKQFMGFLLLATVVWLVPIYGALTGEGWTGWMLFALLFLGMAAWAYGRWGIPRTLLVVLVGGLALHTLLPHQDTWQPWTPGAVDASLTQGKPVFVDFTAAWCLSCKVNERVALETDAVKKAFAQKDVALFRGDWTKADPHITETLQQYHRDGVPLYLLYSPKAKNAPQVLPEVLTPGIVLDALNKI